MIKTTNNNNAVILLSKQYFKKQSTKTFRNLSVFNSNSQGFVHEYYLRNVEFVGIIV